MQKLIAAIVFTGVSLNAAARDDITYTCTLDDAKRIIEVVYTTEEPLSCEIRYTKAGETQVLWTYNNELDACEIQAESFVQKQTTWGWRCSNDSQTDNQSSQQLQHFKSEAAFSRNIMVATDL